MKSFIVYFIVVLNSLVIISCEKTDPQIELVKNFLAEKEFASKVKYLRFANSNPDSTSLSKQFATLPKNYLEIIHSDEFIDSTESIVKVVLKKYRIGLKIINSSQEIFLIKENDGYRIDYEATFNSSRFNIDSVFNETKDSTILVKAFTGTAFSYRYELVLNGKKVISSMIDNTTNNNFYILDSTLHQQIINSFSQENLYHIIVRIKRVKFENIYMCVLDSVVQRGWIEKKFLYKIRG